MKKICRSVSIMLVMAMVLVGCGNTDTSDTEENTQQTESSVTDQEEETSSATSETTETEITTEIETEVQTEVENEAQTETEVSSEPEAPTYTYTDLDKTMYAKSSVNVRDLPSTDGGKLGGLSKAQEVHVTGQCNETSWYRIEYNGGIGYVSGSYLVNDKPVEEVATQPTQPSATQYDGYDEFGNGYTLDQYGKKHFNVECPYTLGALYDNGSNAITIYFWKNDNNWPPEEYQANCEQASAILRERYGLDGSVAINCPVGIAGYYTNGTLYKQVYTTVPYPECREL